MNYPFRLLPSKVTMMCVTATAKRRRSQAKKQNRAKRNARRAELAKMETKKSKRR